MLFLFMIAITFTATAQRFQAIIGNGYGEQKGHGDLTYRFGELRWLPLPVEDRKVKFGFFANGTQVSSEINHYVYQGQEATLGLTLEYCPDRKYSLTDIYSWFNLGYKFSKDKGWTSNNDYSSQQRDQMIYFFGGLVFDGKLNQAFYRNKFTLVYQNPVATEGKATFRANDVTGGFWNKEYLGLVFESSIFSTPINSSGSLKLDPAIYVGYSHEYGNQKDYGQYGVRLIFGRDIDNQELLTLSGGFRISQNLTPMLELGAMLNLAEAGRLLRRTSY